MKVVPPTSYAQHHRQQMLMATPVHYRIRHHTRFRYSHAVTEGFMELRMQPISDEQQQCNSFKLIVEPQARVLAYHDFMGNIVNHFNVPGKHDQLLMKTETAVACYPHPPLPSTLTSRSWQEIDTLKGNIEFWDFLWPSHFAKPTNKLLALAAEIGLERRLDPLTLLRWLNTAVYEQFAYVPSSTEVDSPIDEALTNRQGVCQDFAHIMTALARRVGIPCRYVSGYLFHSDDEDRSLEDASHAWIEAWLPEIGWVGFDPTNNLIAEDRHIRVAVGRDYADVPPTRGVFRGDASSELDVGVQVSRTDEPMVQPTQLLTDIEWHAPNLLEAHHQQQQQQQQ
jgi:transglutaminase-like putative cysteine protease